MIFGVCGYMVQKDACQFSAEIGKSYIQIMSTYLLAVPKRSWDQDLESKLEGSEKLLAGKVDKFET